MKTDTTTKTPGRAQGQSEQGFRAQAGEFNKYLVLLWQGREQVMVFPLALKHAEVFRQLKREYTDLTAVSAGVYLAEGGLVWCTGDSQSLKFSSRPDADWQALEAFLDSPDREQWDLTRLSAEAQEEARQEMAAAGWC